MLLHEACRTSTKSCRFFVASNMSGRSRCTANHLSYQHRLLPLRSFISHWLILVWAQPIQKRADQLPPFPQYLSSSQLSRRDRYRKNQRSNSTSYVSWMQLLLLLNKSSALSNAHATTSNGRVFARGRFEVLLWDGWSCGWFHLILSTLWCCMNTHLVSISLLSNKLA